MDKPINAPQKPHAVSVSDRARVTISGVNDVDSFNEQMIALNTTAGAMTVSGDELHVTKLSLEDGSLIIDGKIVAIEYDDRVRPSKGSGISRLFK